MNDNLRKIKQYLTKQGYFIRDENNMTKTSFELAMVIMYYAHKDQRRENGEIYANHPLRVLNNYRKLVNLGSQDFLRGELMKKHGLPSEGVQEVCLLHDVVEDGCFTFDEVRQMFVDSGFMVDFDLHIGDALKRITHDKSVSYEEYMNICLENPISSIVKMMDLQDNLRVIDLVSLTNERYERASKYLKWIFVINDKYHFVEKVNEYLYDFNFFINRPNEHK